MSAAPLDPAPAPVLRPAVGDAPLPGARGALALLLTINLFNYIDRSILAAVLPKIGETFFPGEDLTSRTVDTKLGLLGTAFLVSYMLVSPVFGWLGDRVNRWVIIGIGVVLWSLASGGSGLAVTYGMLLATRVFVGLGEAAYGPTAPTVISDLYPIRRRGGVLAWFYMAIPVGYALGYAMGGLVESAWGWRGAFYAVVPPGLLLGSIAFFRRDPARGLADAASTRRSRLRLADYGVLVRTPSYVLNTLGMTAMTFAVGGISIWMPKYVFARYVNDGLAVEGQSGVLAHVNLIFGGILVVSGLVATLAGGLIGDRLRARMPGSYFLVSGVGMLVGFPLFVASLYVPFPLAWVFIGLAIFCLFLNTGPTNTILANVTHPSIRSSAFALNILVIHLLGDAVSPPIIGFITDLTKTSANPKGDMNAGFLLVSLTILASGVFWIWGARHLQRDTELAPTRLS